MKLSFPWRQFYVVLLTVLESEVEKALQLVKIRTQENTVISLSNRSNKDIGNGNPKVSLLRYIKLLIVINFPKLT